MRITRKKTLAALAVGTLALGLMIPAGPAQADAEPSGSDIVGVGSDTLQFMLDFGADGDFNADPGFNSGKLSRLISIDATPDSNARAGYLNGSTTAALLPLTPTVVLRAGTQPVQRPNGSGAGLAALLLDTGTGSNETINFVRSSSAPNSPGAAYHVVRLAHETLSLATATATHAPPLSAAQLKSIYTCADTTWTQVGGTSTDTILPVIPQSGSGTRNTFLTDIGFTITNNVVNPPLGTCVRTDEENNPYALYLVGDNPATDTPVADPYANTAIANADAIEPFSGARYNLYHSGYFTNPTVTFGNTAPAGDQTTLNPGIVLATTGSPSDSGTVYKDERGLYVIFRQSDITSTAHFDGSTKNWVQTLFYDPSNLSGPYFSTGAPGQVDLASAGVVADYSDCGQNPSSATSCGSFNGP